MQTFIFYPFEQYSHLATTNPCVALVKANITNENVNNNYGNTFSVNTYYYSDDDLVRIKIRDASFRVRNDYFKAFEKLAKE